MAIFVDHEGTTYVVYLEKQYIDPDPDNDRVAQSLLDKAALQAGVPVNPKLTVAPSRERPKHARPGGVHRGFS